MIYYTLKKCAEVWRDGFFWGQDFSIFYGAYIGRKRTKRTDILIFMKTAFMPTNIRTKEALYCRKKERNALDFVFNICAGSVRTADPDVFFACRRPFNPGRCCPYSGIYFFHLGHHDDDGTAWILRRCQTFSQRETGTIYACHCRRRHFYVRGRHRVFELVNFLRLGERLFLAKLRVKFIIPPQFVPRAPDRIHCFSYVAIQTGLAYSAAHSSIL